jgi:putative nucleotidyltransferase with HDIG domain
MGPYQFLPSPPTSESEPRRVARPSILTFRRTTTDLRWGTTALRLYTPFGGRSRKLGGVPKAWARTSRLLARSEPIHWFGLVLAALAGGLATGLVLSGEGIEAPKWMVAALAGLALVAEKQSVRISSHTEVSVSGLPILFAAVIDGPLAGMVVGAAALLGEWSRPYARWLVWTASRSLVGGLAGLAAALVFASTDDDLRFGTILVAVAFAGVVEAGADGGFVALTARLRRNNSFARELRTMIRLAVATLPLHIPVVGVLAYVYGAISAWTVVAFLIPAVAFQRLLMLYREQRELTDDLVGANERLRRAGLSFASGLIAALDARDRYTAGHSAAVAIYARDIAGELGLSPDEQRTAHLAGLLHDVGKVGLPAGILEKEGPLTGEERRIMQEHSVIGERILANIDGYREVAAIVRHHHERCDGTGYPDRLLSGGIPLVSRILAVADAYNAMTSERPYRSALPASVARERIREQAGGQFDASVVEAFDRLLATSDDEYLTGRHQSFRVEAQQHPGLRLAPVPAAA